MRRRMRKPSRRRLCVESGWLSCWISFPPCAFCEPMIILHDPQCANYGSYQRPEQPARVVKTTAHLRTAHPDWEWRLPPIADEATVLLAHTPAHLKRLQQPV